MSHSHSPSHTHHGHSVAEHLHVHAAEYDTQVRRLVPHYDEAHAEVALALATKPPASVLDVGCGTGALSATLAQQFPAARFTALDADASMLEQARHRLAQVAERCSFVHGRFLEASGQFDAVVASLALHHVPSRDEKRQVYALLRERLNEGGVLVNADAMVPRDPTLAGALQDRWAEHLMQHGFTRAEALGHFAQWKREDFYFSIDEELSLLRDAGFSGVELRWRRGPLGVLVARR